MDRSVRGSVLNAYLKFVEKRWGQDGLGQCVKDIGVDGTFKDGDYYRDDYRENILRWIEREKGPGEVFHFPNKVGAHICCLSVNSAS